MYVGGRHLATYGDGSGGMTYFVQADWLGTERTRVLPSGDLAETCTNFPFGDGLNCNSSAGPGANLIFPSPDHFTGKELDVEDGLNYFGARYYSSSLGRFITPDWAAKPAAIPYAVLGDPQSLNLYSYVRNRPTAMADPDGHEVGCSGQNQGSNCTETIDYSKVQTTTNDDHSITVSQTATFNARTENSDGTTTLTTTDVTTSVTVQTNGTTSASLTVGDTTTTTVAPLPNGQDGIKVLSSSTAATADTGTRAISTTTAYQLFGGSDRPEDVRAGYQIVANAVIIADQQMIAKQSDQIVRHVRQAEDAQEMHNGTHIVKEILDILFGHH